MTIDEQKPINVKLKVKPVFGTLVHSSNNEGPCRVGSKKELDPKFDRDIS